MQYLSKTVPIYECGKCGATGRLEGMCECCNVTVRYYDDEPATYWSVAVYETGLNYGGPEEGGWWYECGWLIDPHKQRVFDSITKSCSIITRTRRISPFTVPVPGYPVYC